MFVEAQEAERMHLLVAASIGILEVTHAAIPNHPLQCGRWTFISFRGSQSPTCRSRRERFGISGMASSRPSRSSRRLSASEQRRKSGEIPIPIAALLRSQPGRRRK